METLEKASPKQSLDRNVPSQREWDLETLKKTSQNQRLGRNVTWGRRIWRTLKKPLKNYAWTLLHHWGIGWAAGGGGNEISQLSSGPPEIKFPHYRPLAVVAITACLIKEKRPKSIYSNAGGNMVPQSKNEGLLAAVAMIFSN